MRSYQGRKCLCCKNCSRCQEFRKVISDNGFDIYNYVKHSKAITKGKDVVGSNGFVFTNMHNVAINKNEILQKIESSEFNCERCKSVLIQVSKILQDPIQENNILVICASCINRCTNRGLQRCKFCHRIYDRFISSKKLQGVTTEDYASKWSSEIQHLLAEERYGQVDNQLITSDIESQQMKAILSHQLRTTTETVADVVHEQLDVKVVPSGEESQEIKTIKTPLPQITTEKDADVDIVSINKLKLELRNVTQDIKHLMHSSQQSYEEKYGSEEITKISQKAKSQEAFDYVFPQIDFRQLSLRKHISSSELFKEIIEKVEKQRSYSAKKEIKTKAIDKGKFKMKKPTLASKHVHIDEEQDKFPSKSESKTLNESLRRKEKSEKEIDDVDDNIEPEIKIKKKEKYKAGDTDDYDAQEIKIKRKDKHKVIDKDIVDKGAMDIKVKKKEKYKTAAADIDDNYVIDIKAKKKEKYKTTDIDAGESDVVGKKRKEKGQKDLGVKKTQKDGQAFKQIRSTEGSGDGFDFSKIMSKKKSKDEDENLLSIKKKKNKKGSKLSVSESTQISSKKDKSRATVPKESNLQKTDKSEKQKTEKKSKLLKKSKSATPEDLKISDVKMRNASIDDFHINMVKIRHSVYAREKQKTRHPDTSVLEQKGSKITSSAIFEEIESINENEIEELLKKVKLKEINEVIIGKKIVKHRRYLDKIGKKNVQPMLFEATFQQQDTEEVVKKEAYQPEKKSLKKESAPLLYRKSKSLHKFTEQDAAKGGIHYRLSNRSFIDKGWTMLPTEKIVRKMNIYRMRPSHPEFDWFEHNKDKRLMHYDTGEPLAEIEEDGRGQWFYRNGRLALDYYNAEEVNAGQRYVVYSNGEPDEKGRPRPITVLATFDYLGNGIVFDHTGKVRLKYNQTEGAVLDKDIGPVSHWKWHELNDPPILQKVMIDTQMAIKDPEIYKMGGTGENVPRADNEEMLAIEFDNFIKEKSKKLTQKFKPFQIKMKALKINENFSLRVLDQATVYLLFRDGPTNLKLNLGMILDHKQIVDTDTAEVGEVTCNLERLPARTDSLAMLQRSVAHAQHIEKLRMERECRFRLSEVKPSIDRLTAAVSRPLKVPLLTQPEIECMCTKRN